MTRTSERALRLDHADVVRAGEDAGVPAAVVDELWAQLVRSAAPRPLGLPNVVRYLGASVLLVAMGLFLGTSWAEAGSRAGLLVVLGYLAGLTAVCELLGRRGQQRSAGLVAATVVALVPLAVYAAQESFLLFTTREFGSYDDFFAFVSSQWTVMEAVTLLATIVVWRRYRTSFLLLPAAVAAWFASMDVGVAVGGDRAPALTAAFVAVALLVVGTLLDRRALRGEGFWMHLSGLASLSYALSAVDLDAGAGSRMLLTGLCGIALLAAGVTLERRVHLVFGGLFSFAALSYLAFEVFGGSPLFAVCLGGLGLLVVLGALRLDRYAGERPPAGIGR